MNKPCEKCPWTSKDQRDKDALTSEIKAAAARGNWFCCHVHMGTCYGAARFAKSQKVSLEKGTQ